MDSPIKLETVIKDLHNISGFRITVYDINFKQLIAYPSHLCSFCQLIRDNDQAENICLKTDIKAFNIAKETKRVYLYQCEFGLYEAVAPIYSFSVLTGYLMMGQILDSFDSSRSFVYNTAKPFVADRQKLEEAVSKIPIRSKEKILSCISIMNICAEYITLANRLNISSKDLSQEVKDYIDLNFTKKITIDFLCNRFFCSKATLINSFKKKYDYTINNYINKVRIENAAKQITFSDKPINIIAKSCGFEDQNYFSKVFLKYTNDTPSQFRLKNSGRN